MRARRGRVGWIVRGVVAAGLCIPVAGATAPPSAAAGGRAPGLRAIAPDTLSPRCVILFNCGAAQGAEPTVALSDPQDVSATGAILTGTVDPGGEPATYSFEYAPANGTSAPIRTPTEALQSGGTQTVSAAVAGLTPDTEYAVALVATNAVGTVNATGEFQTQPSSAGGGGAPPPVTASAQVSVAHVVVPQGTPVTVTAALTSPAAQAVAAAGQTTATLVSDPVLAALTLPSFSRATLSPGGTARFLPVTPLRNTQFRVEVGSIVSDWLQVYVTPLIELYSLPDPHDKRVVQLEFSAEGELPAHDRSGPVAYFYRGASRTGPFTRVASARFRRVGSSLDARARIRLPKADAGHPGYFVSCTQTPIVPDMGKPFRNARCGAITDP